MCPATTAARRFGRTPSRPMRRSTRETAAARWSTATISWSACPTAGANVPDGGGGSVGLGFAIPVDSADPDRRPDHRERLGDARVLRPGTAPIRRLPRARRAPPTGLFVNAVAPGRPVGPGRPAGRRHHHRDQRRSRHQRHADRESDPHQEAGRHRAGHLHPRRPDRPRRRSRSARRAEPRNPRQALECASWQAAPDLVG